MSHDRLSEIRARLEKYQPGFDDLSADLEWAVAELEKLSLKRDMAQALEDGAAEIERLKAEVESFRHYTERLAEDLEYCGKDIVMQEQYIARLEARLRESLKEIHAVYLHGAYPNQGFILNRERFVEAEMAKLKDGK